MNSFVEKLEDRIYTLRQIVEEKEKALEKAPEGTVHVFCSDGRTQFYLHEKAKRRYIRECERDLVEKLCQKDYDQKVLIMAQKELKELEKVRRNYPEKACENIYEKIHKERKRHISPIWLPDNEYIEKWENAEYERKGFYHDAPEFYTNKGERVRSKTEILIANALEKYKVPYRYEAPLKLERYGVIHPDFTVLNVPHRKELYWEHMGLLDDQSYRDHALERILAYEKNGIFPGDRLILTHETQKNPVNSRIIEKLIHQYLLYK